MFAELEIYLIQSFKRNLKRHQDWEKDEGFEWSAWQAEKLREINIFRRQNKKIAKNFISRILPETRKMLIQQYQEGSDTTPSFFGINERRLNGLIDEMLTIEQDVTKAALRNVDDAYRQTILKAAAALNSGTMTLYQAVDMASKEFLSKGINCIQYKDGRRVNIVSYAEMALRVNATRSRLYGQRAKMKEMGIDTVIISQYGGCSPTCLPWQGKVYIDDVFCDFDGKKGVSWGVSSNGKSYMLLSYAMKNGLFHPNCRHNARIYIEGVTRIPAPLDKDTVNKNYALEQQQRKLEREVRQAKRIEAGTLDDEKKKEYTAYRKWKQKQLREFINENSDVLRRDLWREKVEPGLEGNNTIKDLEQYQKYTKVLQEMAPGTIEEFLEIKHNNSVEYGKLKHAYRIANQYENNSGKMSPTKVVELHDFAVDCKAKFTGKARTKANIGVMIFDGEKYIANSQVNDITDPPYYNYKGDKSQIILKPVKAEFTPFVVGPHLRDVDSEYKMFEYVAIVAKDGKTHTVEMLSEKAMCKSCQSVMRDFQKRYPNVDVAVVSNKAEKAEKNHNKNPIFEFDTKRKFENENN